jgi:lipopolysaccharide/colanic/teichoic acid biosynthesis glycosyltransferase
MRILYATQWFEPEPILKGAYFAKLLQERGHDVRVVTGFPNYPEGVLYPGYNLKWLRRDIVQDVPVDRVPLYPNHSRSVLGRILNYASFAVSLSVYGILNRTRTDVLYAYHPPLTVGLAAALIATVRRLPLVYDVQDMWPDTLAATGMLSNPIGLKIIGTFCRWVYARADRIVVQSPGFKEILIRRGVPATKIAVIYNWANEADTRPRSDTDLSAFALAGRFNVVYAGAIGPSQGLDTVVRAAKLLEEKHPRVQFILVGEGIEVEHLRRLATERDAKSVRMMPRLPPSDIASLLDASDALLVHLKDEALFGITIPSKTQFYLAMGKPIIMGVRGDAAALIEQADAGVMVRPQDPSGLADAVEQLASLPPDALAAMGERGRSFYYRHLSAAIGVEHTVAVLDEAISSRKPVQRMRRIFDIIVALCALTILGPIALIASIALWFNLGSPTLFRQTRAGLNGKPFCLYKLRTMGNARDPLGRQLSDAERLTAISRFVRRLSIDEVPQLWNVLRGDMNLVGPRPLLMSYLDRYTPEQARRHEVNPGLTGWAQVNGRNAVSWERKLELDCWYVKNRSFGLDLKILAMTAIQVISGRGISAADHETMPEFRGTLDAAKNNEPNQA